MHSPTEVMEAEDSSPPTSGSESEPAVAQAPKCAGAAATKTLRFAIELVSDDDKYEYNWLDLIAERNEKREQRTEDRMGQATPFGGTALDPDASDDEEQMRALARQFETKYGAEDVKRKKKARKLDDYADLGYGYDSNDPFIDNSEVHDEIVPANLTTAHGGFYVNIGALEFKARESADEDSDVEAIINEGEKAEKKRKYHKKKEMANGATTSSEEPPPKKKKFKKIKNADGTTSIVPVARPNALQAELDGPSGSASDEFGSKRPRIRREGAKPLGRPKKRNPDGSLVHPPKLPRVKHPVLLGGHHKERDLKNGSAGHGMGKNKKGRPVMKVTTPGSYSSNSTSVVDLTEGEEKSSTPGDHVANDDVVRLLQSVSEQVGKKLTSGEPASASYKGVTITATGGSTGLAPKPKKPSAPIVPKVSLVPTTAVASTSSSTGGAANKAKASVTVKKLLEEQQQQQQKPKNQGPPQVSVKKKPNTTGAHTSAHTMQQQLHHQKKQQQKMVQQQQEDLIKYMAALAAYDQSRSASSSPAASSLKATNELMSALAGLSASGALTPESYAQLIATQGQMNDVMMQQMIASMYPPTSSPSPTSSARKGSVTSASVKPVSSGTGSLKAKSTSGPDKKSATIVSKSSASSSQGASALSQAAASAAAVTKAKLSNAHSIENLSKSSVQSAVGQSLLLAKQSNPKASGGGPKGSVQVVSSTITKASPGQTSKASVTLSSGTLPNRPGGVTVTSTSSLVSSISSQQQQLLRQEQFKAQQKEFAQIEQMAKAKYDMEEMVKKQAEQERQDLLLEKNRKEQEELKRRKEQEELKRRREQEEIKRQQETARKKLEEQKKQEALQKQRELEALRQQEQEMLRKKQQEQEILRKKQQEQEMLRKRQEQEMLRKRQEQELLRKQQEQEILRKQQELLRKQQEQEILRKQQEQELLRKKQLEQEMLRKKHLEQEMLRKKQQEQDMLRKKHLEQEMLRKKQQEQEMLRQQQQEQEMLRKKQQEQELLRKKQLEQQMIRKKQMEQEMMRKKEQEKLQLQQLHHQQQQQQQRTIYIQQDGSQGYSSNAGMILNSSPTTSSGIAISNYSLGNNTNQMNGSIQQIIHSSPQRISPLQQQLSIPSPMPKQPQLHQQQSPQSRQVPHSSPQQIIVQQSISPQRSANFALSMSHTNLPTSNSNVHFLQQQKQQIIVSSSANLNQGSLKMSNNLQSGSQSMKLPSMPNTSMLTSTFGGSVMMPQSPMYAQANNSSHLMNAQQMQVQQQQQQHLNNSLGSPHVMVSSTNNLNSSVNPHGYFSVQK